MTINPRRSPRVLVLSLAAVLALATVAAPGAFGQNVPLRVPGDVPPLPAEPFDEPGLQPIVPAEGMVPLPVVGGEPHAPDYWIVSSRRGRQSNVPSLPGGQLDYFHVGGDWRMRGADEPSFRGSLVPGVPVCIIVHGSYVEWPELVRESGTIYRWVRSAAPGQPLQIVFYTWPSESQAFGLPHVDVGILGRRAAFNGVYVAHLLERVPIESPVCFLAHSLGASVVSSTLHLMAGGEVQNQRLHWPAADGRRIRAVFFAAAIDRHWLNPGERYGLALCRAEGLLNLRNRDDLPLAFYPLRRPFAHRALGREGFKPKYLQRMGPQAAKVAELDVTAFLGSGHFWQHYYRRPEIAAAIVDWLYFSEPQVQTAPLQPAAVPPQPAPAHALQPAVPAGEVRLYYGSATRGR